MVARGVQRFCILEGATDPMIEQWLRFFVYLVETFDEQTLKISSQYLERFKIYCHFTEKFWQLSTYSCTKKANVYGSRQTVARIFQLNGNKSKIAQDIDLKFSVFVHHTSWLNWQKNLQKEMHFIKKSGWKSGVRHRLKWRRGVRHGFEFKEVNQWSSDQWKKGYNFLDCSFFFEDTCIYFQYEDPGCFSKKDAKPFTFRIS